MRFFYSEKCIQMILWIANPLCDDTACWHAALRVLRAEAAKIQLPTKNGTFLGFPGKHVFKQIQLMCFTQGLPNLPLLKFLSIWIIDAEDLANHLECPRSLVFFYCHISKCTGATSINLMNLLIGWKSGEPPGM